MANYAAIDIKIQRPQMTLSIILRIDCFIKLLCALPLFLFPRSTFALLTGVGTCASDDTAIAAHALSTCAGIAALAQLCALMLILLALIQWKLLRMRSLVSERVAADVCTASQLGALALLMLNTPIASISLHFIICVLLMALAAATVYLRMVSCGCA